MPRPDLEQALQGVLHHPAIWRAEQLVQSARPGLASGYPALDQALPDAGWPAAALSELLSSAGGIGEVLLLTPALRAVCEQGRGVALLAPPWLPHAQAWAAAGIPLERLLVVEAEGVDVLWSAEQILRSGECGAVLLWSQAAGRALRHRALQRLQLAAAEGNAACFLYRGPDAQTAPSPAALRLQVAAQDGALQVRILKCRGAWSREAIRLQPFPAHWQPGAEQLPAALPSPSRQTVRPVPARLV